MLLSRSDNFKAISTAGNPLLIFDLGNVIVPYDDKLLIRNMAACCESATADTEIPEYFKRDWNVLQTGVMHDDQLYQKFVGGLGFKGDFPDFQKVWCSHTGKDDRMEKMVMDLTVTHTVVVLSNSTATHWDHFNANYPVLQKLDGLYASHLLGVVKPNAEAFEKVLAAEKRNAKDAIFIDDYEQMADGARAAGLTGIRFTGYDQLIADLSRVGVISFSKQNTYLPNAAP